MAAKPVPPRPVPRLYLATPVVDDPEALLTSLPQLLAQADVAAVLLRQKPSDPRTMISRIKALAPAVQNKGAALLLDGHAELVARGGADGAHLTGIEALQEALPTLKPDRIAGIGGLATRHDSMAAGELGADYVLFGEPDAHGQRPSVEAISERLQWWDELFEPPCVGFASASRRGRHVRGFGRGFRVGRRLHLGRSARRGHGAERGRAGDPAGPRCGVRKSQGSPRITGGHEDPASNPGLRNASGVDGKRGGASLARADGGANAGDVEHTSRKGESKAGCQEAAATSPAATPAPTATVTPAPVPDDPNLDLVYGAYQRGFYKTAFDLATKRAEENGDPKAMTMLGELYANAMGVKRDDAKAAQWYKRAADSGDREAMFELAMLRLAGRGGAVNREEAAKLLASSAKLGNPKAAYNLALLYLDGQTLPQDLRRSAELLRIAADAGSAEAQYALATFYKEGTGVPKDPEKAVRLLQAASLADNVDAEVEYAIALYNGTGTPKNEAAAVALLRKAAKRNSPVAQNRLARVLASGTPADRIEALKWHTVAKTAGKGDPELDEALAKLSAEDRAKADAAARKWLGTK